MIRFPEQRFSVVCLANLSTINPSKLCRQVADIYLADQFKPKKEKKGAAPATQAKFIKLSEKELKERTGTFINPETGTIWKLSLKDGKLMVEAGGFSFQISPISKTQFRSVDAPEDIDIKFEEQGKNKPLLMQVHIEGRKPSTLEAVQLVSPTPAQLSNYVGDYYSDELQVSYKVVLEDGKLFFKHRNAPDKPLEPTLRDKFSILGLNIDFIRNEQNKVTALIVNADRVKNIRFKKNRLNKSENKWSKKRSFNRPLRHIVFSHIIYCDLILSCGVH